MARSIMKPKRRSMDVNSIAHQLVERTAREGKTFAEWYEQEHSQPVTPEDLKALDKSDLPKIAVANPGISEYMAAIGSKGGKIGGKRRLKTMTAEQRKKSAQKAAKARWKKK